MPAELRLLSSGQVLLAWAVSDPCCCSCPRALPSCRSPLFGEPPAAPLPWAEALLLLQVAGQICPHCPLPGLARSSGVCRLPAVCPCGEPRQAKGRCRPSQAVGPVGSRSRRFRKPPLCSSIKRRLCPVARAWRSCLEVGAPSRLSSSPWGPLPFPAPALRAS